MPTRSTDKVRAISGTYWAGKSGYTIIDTITDICEAYDSSRCDNVDYYIVTSGKPAFSLSAFNDLFERTDPYRMPKA